MVLGWKCAGEGLDRQFRCVGMCPWWLQLRDAAHCTVGMGMWRRGDGDEGMRVQEWGCCAIIPGADREICCVFGKFRGGETKPCTLSSSLQRVPALRLPGGGSASGTCVSTVWGGCSKRLHCQD